MRPSGRRSQSGTDDDASGPFWANLHPSGRTVRPASACPGRRGAHAGSQNRHDRAPMPPEFVLYGPARSSWCWHRCRSTTRFGSAARRRTRWTFPSTCVLAAEPAHLPQYVILFALGVVAYRGDWLRRLPARLGIIWLAVGLAASATMYALQGMAPDRWDDVLASGGLNWPSLVRSTWETVIAISLCVGLIVFFREVVHRPNRLIVAMAAASYAA